MAADRRTAPDGGLISALILAIACSNVANLLIARGAKRIVVIPYFLTLGTHLQRDLPRLAQSASRDHGDIEIEITAPLDGHPALVEALLDRASEALGAT